MNERPFDSFRQEHRPLSGLLAQRAGTARQAAQGFRAANKDESDEADLAAQFLSDWESFALPVQRVRTPELAHREPVSVVRQDESRMHRHGYWRWYYHMPLSGNVELLDYWPDECDIEPCDGELYFEPAPEYSWQWNPAKSRLSVAIDVSHAEDPEGDIPPTERLVAAVRYLDSIILAANGQLETFERELRQDVATAVSNRLRRLGIISSRNEATIELIAREVPALEVVEPSLSPDRQASPVPQVRVDGQSISLDLAVAEATFEALLDVCERWRLSAQRYPDSFSGLNEENITSHLVMTLNVVFDTAQREVFVGKGKTDIYVEMLRANQGRAAYIGEAKIWGGPADIPAHFGQLLGYTVEHLREVLLIYYIRNRRIGMIRKNVVQAIENLPFWDEWVTEDPLVARIHHPEYGFSLAVAILFVHLPPI